MNVEGSELAVCSIWVPHSRHNRCCHLKPECGKDLSKRHTQLIMKLLVTAASMRSDLVHLSRSHNMDRLLVGKSDRAGLAFLGLASIMPRIIIQLAYRKSGCQETKVCWRRRGRRGSCSALTLFRISIESTRTPFHHVRYDAPIYSLPYHLASFRRRLASTSDT